MAKPKGSKFKKRDKKKVPRGGGNGFTKTKLIKGFESSASISPAITTATPKRSLLNRSLNADEEVYIVRTDGVLDDQPASLSFNQLSSTSFVTDTTASVSSLLDLEEDTGFFFDSTPSDILTTEQVPEISSPISRGKNHQRKKQRIIQDESVYIESDNEDDALEDDRLSISSSEDIEILSSLSHWGSRDIMHADVPSVKSMHDDYALLSMTYLDEICYSDEETEEEEEEEEVIAFDEIGLDLESIENVPDSLKNSYRAMMREEQRLFETQTKRYHNMNKKRKTVEKNKDKSLKNRDKSILDKIIRFVEGNEKTFTLSNPTQRGRMDIAPKLANIFQLQVNQGDEKSITLHKTTESHIPKSLNVFRQKSKIQVGGKTKKKMGHSKERPKAISRRDRFEIRDNAMHGQQVGSSSTPISSDNVGHRMLAAMGWKEGSSIGNTEDGIKEPVKVFMRANRRGLGA